jgi:GT2 family glycosyltransferase
MPPDFGSEPRVTVIILNFNGARHLEACFASLEALDYPAVELMLADNGSRDGSVALVRRRFPRVRVFELGANLGFAPAYNRAVKSVDTRYVAFLNNDTRVAPSWLSELVDAARRHGAAAAAATILDWEGARIDFVGGLPTAIGHSWQIDYGQPVGGTYPERRLLFGCGGSVLIDRDTFVSAGGFDDDFFAYFEDVDLGWRMNVLGHSTVFAPRAITYHRLHGTFGSMAHALRLRLYERNALALISKNYSDEMLAAVLPAAVGLTLARNLETAPLDGSQIRFGAASPPTAAMPSQLVAALLALEDFARWLPALREKRARIQAARRIPDAQILPLLPEPLKLHDAGDQYRETALALIRDFRIAERFGLPSPAPRVFVAGRPNLLEPELSAAPAEPRVSVVVLTASGATHLPDCLDSLRGHDWPAHRTEVIVVDNGSSTDPTPIAEQHYPGVKVVRTGRNLGFSAGNNAGARAATGDYVVFLNDDTRVDAAWLDELVGVAERRRAGCVGALMVDWSGARIDFAGGLVNFEGRGFATHYDEPVAAVEPVEEPVLFACGGAVLFRRDVFASAGGWDEPTFAYYEDVEFGWRLWLLGHEVWLAPKAIVYHKHHGTSGAGDAARIRAFERNGLRMIYALLETERLERVLPAALLMAADRALLQTPFSRAAENGAAAGHRQRLLSPRIITASFRHALIQRGARRHLGVARSLRRLGVGGLVGALGDAVGDVVSSLARRGARERYLIERQGGSTALDAQSEGVPAVSAAVLLGIQDFLRMLPDLSARRAVLQARRKRSDQEILARFGARWTAAVPSRHADLHAALRSQVIEIFRLTD